MKKSYKSFILPMLFSLFTTFSFSQTPLVVEYESSPPPNSIIAILIGLFSPDDFDFNGDGKRDIVVRVGNNLVVRTFSQPDNMVFNGTAAGISLDDYRCLGFHDIGGGAEKELVLVPKSFTFGDVIISSYYNMQNEFLPSFSWGATQGGTWFYGVGNTDGDPQSEILALLPNQEFYVLGQGFTPGLTGDNPIDKFKGKGGGEKVMLGNFEIQLIMPPTFRWPSNFTYVEPGYLDFNKDYVNDFGYIKFDGVDGECAVISGGNHDTLYYNEAVPTESFSLNFQDIKVTYFDPTGDGQKYIMIGGSNSGNGLSDLEQIMWLDPQTNEANFSLLPYMEQGFRVVAIGSQFNQNNTGGVGIVMRHNVTGRVIVLGDDGSGFQGGGGSSSILTGQPTQDGSAALAYSLNMVFESQVPVALFMPGKAAFSGLELDVNNDGVVDLPNLVLVDSVGNELAGFTVLDGVTHQPVWETTVPAGGSIDPAPFFHGFFDANGDGVKEIIYGAETVQTHDSEIHKPFGTGFQIRYIYDIDGDGFEEIIGETPQGKIQVWSSHSFVSGAFERQLQETLGLSVFPNPTQGNFMMKIYPPAKGDVTMEVFDSKGVLVQNMNLKQDLSSEPSLGIELANQLPSGQYFIRICSASGCSTQKIILKR